MARRPLDIDWMRKRMKRAVPSFKAMLEEIEKGFLHHIGDFVSFKWRTDENHRSHRRHHVVGRNGLGFLEERFPLLFRARQAAFVLGIAQRVGIVSCKPFVRQIAITYSTTTATTTTIITTATTTTTTTTPAITRKIQSNTNFKKLQTGK